MENYGLLKKLLFLCFSVAVVLLGANDVLHSAKDTGENNIRVEDFIPFLTAKQLSLDQSRFSEESLTRLKNFRSKNGISQKSKEMFYSDGNTSPEEEL